MLSQPKQSCGIAFRFVSSTRTPIECPPCSLDNRGCLDPMPTSRFAQQKRRLRHWTYPLLIRNTSSRYGEIDVVLIQSTCQPHRIVMRSTSRLMPSMVRLWSFLRYLFIINLHNTLLSALALIYHFIPPSMAVAPAFFPVPLLDASLILSIRPCFRLCYHCACICPLPFFFFFFFIRARCLAELEEKLPHSNLGSKRDEDKERASLHKECSSLVMLYIRKW
jgi:hypothetical protein